MVRFHLGFNCIADVKVSPARIVQFQGESGINLCLSVVKRFFRNRSIETYRSLPFACIAARTIRH